MSVPLAPTCPLLHQANSPRILCRRAACAWWVPDPGVCAVVAIAATAVRPQVVSETRTKPAQTRSKG